MAKALRNPAKSQERKRLMSLIVNLGDYEHNSRTSKNNRGKFNVMKKTDKPMTDVQEYISLDYGWLKYFKNLETLVLEGYPLFNWDDELDVDDVIEEFCQNPLSKLFSELFTNNFLEITIVTFICVQTIGDVIAPRN